MFEFVAVFAFGQLGELITRFASGFVKEREGGVEGGHLVEKDTEGEDVICFAGELVGSERVELAGVLHIGQQEVVKVITVAFQSGVVLKELHRLIYWVVLHVPLDLH